MARNVNSISQSGGKVMLNVYDLHENNEFMYPVGLGMYHSGVQVGRVEYTFAGGAGIYSHEPQQVPAGVKLRESIEMGSFRGSSSDIDRIIREMRDAFSGSAYHILNRNCNTFADEFLQRLIGVPSPGYVNRMAFIGSFFSCLLPENLNQDPTQQSSNGGGASTGGVYRSGSNAGVTKQQPIKAFSGAGMKLGGSEGDVSSTRSTSSVGVSLSAESNSSSATGNLVDRRERMRQAALNRIQPTSGST